MATNPLKGLIGGESDEEVGSEAEEVCNGALPGTESSPFSVGTRVQDALFGPGVVKALPSTDPTYTGHGGQAFVEFDDKTAVGTWRTWGHLKKIEAVPRTVPTVPGRTGGAAVTGGVHAFFGPRSSSAAAPPPPRPSREQPAVGGTLGNGSRSGGSTAASASRGAIVVGVRLADHERARKMNTKPEAEGKKRALWPLAGAEAVKKRMTKVPIFERLKEFPNQSLREDKVVGSLHCSACSKTVTNSSHSIKQHIGTAMHRANLVKQNKRNKQDGEIKDLVTDYYQQNPSERLASVPIDVQLERFRVVETLMGNGITISTADGLRPLLERAGMSIGSSSNLRQYIPKVIDVEHSRIKQDVTDEYLGLSLDSTRRQGDAVNVTARYCSADFKIHYRLVLFVTAEKHLNGLDSARLLTQLLLSKYGIDISKVVAFMRDSVASNSVALRGLLGTFSAAADILCLPHTLNHVGEHFNLSTLDAFLTPFIGLICVPGAAKVLWKQMTGESPVGFSQTRWYCKAEIAMQIATHFNQLGSVLTALSSDGIGDATTAKMKQIYSEKRAQLALECAAMLDMRSLVSTTYELEGDRLELLLAYGRVETLRSLGRSLGQEGVLRNVEAVLRFSVKLEQGVKLRKNWPAHGGFFDAKVVSEAVEVDSTIMPGTTAKAWKVKYDVDATTEELEEIELRRALIVSDMVPPGRAAPRAHRAAYLTRATHGPACCRTRSRRSSRH
jgi:hypothetical protein